MIYLKMLLALAFVLGLIALLYRLIQRADGRFLGSSARRRIRVVETASLGEKRRLVVVQVDGTEMLLGVTVHNVSRLAVLSKGKRSIRPVGRPSSPPKLGKLVAGLRGLSAK